MENLESLIPKIKDDPYRLLDLGITYYNIACLGYLMHEKRCYRMAVHAYTIFLEDLKRFHELTMYSWILVMRYRIRYRYFMDDEISAMRFCYPSLRLDAVAYSSLYRCLLDWHSIRGDYAEPSIAQ